MPAEEALSLIHIVAMISLIVTAFFLSARIVNFLKARSRVASSRWIPFSTKSLSLIHIFADAAHVISADYVGIISANNEPQKMEKSGFHVTKSEFVDAPLIDELPVALECQFLKVNEDGNIIGQIVNVSADESVLDAEGSIDFTKFRPISFEPAHNSYHVLGEKVGNAFQDGGKLK